MNPVIYIYVALAMIISAVNDAHGQDLRLPTMKVQGRKNLSGYPKLDAILNHF